MQLAADRAALCIYRRSGFKTVLIHLCADGTTWNPPGHAEARWTTTNSNQEFRFFSADGTCTAELHWNGNGYTGPLLGSINASLEVFPSKQFHRQPIDDLADDVGRQLTLFTVASSFDRGFDMLWKGCQYWGIAPIVLGFGAPFNGSITKVHLLYRALLELESMLTIVMFVDAFDTLLVGSPADIVRRFYDFAHPLVFSAERHCHPAPDRAGKYPIAPTAYRFLNSGTFIGEAAYLINLLANMDVVGRPASGDDQLLFTDCFLKDTSTLALDHHCQLFQCMYASEADVQVDEHGLINTATHSRPLVVHANGGSEMSVALDWLRIDRKITSGFWL